MNAYLEQEDFAFSSKADEKEEELLEGYSPVNRVARYISSVDNRAHRDWSFDLCVSDARTISKKSKYFADQSVATSLGDAFSFREGYYARYNFLMDMVAPVIKKITSFGFLGKDWDSYGADPIDWETIDKSISFFLDVVSHFPKAPLPFVVPCANGSIHFEWERCDSKFRNIIPARDQRFYVYKIIKKTTGYPSHNLHKTLNLKDIRHAFSCWFMEK